MGLIVKAFAVIGLSIIACHADGQEIERLNVTSLPKVALVDERFQSYNVETTDIGTLGMRVPTRTNRS
jgi:hypothetical protein